MRTGKRPVGLFIQATVESRQVQGGCAGSIHPPGSILGKRATEMAWNEQEMSDWGQGANFSLFLCVLLSMPHPPVLARYILRRAEEPMGKVWTWNLYLFCFFKVCRLFVNLPNHPNFFFTRANDYSANLVTSSWKALLLVNVVIGNAATYTTNQSYLTQPPWGCDSVRSTSSSPQISPVTVRRSLASLVARAI